MIIYYSLVIIYRDGVSDGHLSAVIEQELPQITSAFSKFQSDYRPKLAMVVVKKRGNTRFFMQDGQHMANPLPGTIIDNTVTKVNNDSLKFDRQWLNLILSIG